MLRPGVYVARRDATHLQLGLDPPRCAVLPDVPTVRELLRSLAEGSDPGPQDPDSLRTLARLDAAGLVMERPTRPARAGTGDAAARHQFGTDAERRLQARSTARVGIRAAPAAAHAATGLLRAAGIEPVTREEDAGLWLLVSPGEPPRETLDPWLREGVAHLLVTTGPTARVGPLVVPGRTACLRCLDATLGETDPRRPLVVEQVARTAARQGPVPVDPTLEAMALAWAVRELTRYLDGDRPLTWSASVDLDPVAAPAVRQWRRHPHCGCAWDLLG